MDRGLSCAVGGGTSLKDSPRSLMSDLVPLVDGSSELSVCYVICNPSGFRGDSHWPIGPDTSRNWYPTPSRLETFSCSPLIDSAC